VAKLANTWERNDMLGNDVRWRVDRAFALKAIMQYLVNSKQKRITYKKIFSAHPLKGHSKEFDEVKRGHMFMRENAGFDIYEEDYPHFSDRRAKSDRR
jgi:hypothetical protein